MVTPTSVVGYNGRHHPPDSIEQGNPAARVREDLPLNNQNESPWPADQRASDDTALNRDELGNPTIGIEPTNTVARDLSGTTIGDYEILHLIGSGGSGQVYRAQHRHMGRVVALKVLTSKELSSSAAAIRFRREVKASARLMHPNIVTAFDAGEHEDELYLVMEFVDGRSLDYLVARYGPFTVRRAADLISQTARGLAYAHAEGIIHRDIKPGNLMLDRHSHIKILDLGLARSIGVRASGLDDSVDSNLTNQGTIVGTLGYMSPEQVSQARRVDHRTDIYSLGCTLHFLLVGRSPFTGTGMEMLVAHARDPIPNLCEAAEDIPAAFNQVFQKMMAKEPSERYASMDALLDELAPFVAEKPTTSVQSRESAPPAASNTRRFAGPSSQVSVSEGLTATTSRKAVGFDIGTNTAYVTCMGEDGFPRAVGREGQAATASLVRFQDGEFAVGAEALAANFSGAANIADRFVCELGQPHACRTLDGKPLPHEVLTAVVARYVADQAQRQIGYFSHFVYTVPGCFGDAQRRAYADAFHIAYLDPVATIGASTAVVVHFAFLHGWLNPLRPETAAKHLLAIRFGGGSFDVSVFKLDQRQISTLAVAGDASLGGSVWDDRLVSRVADQLKKRYGFDVSADPTRLFLLRRHCESGKIALTEQDQFPFRVQIKNKSLEGVLSRGFVNRLGSDLLERAESLTRQAMEDAGLSCSELDHILLAGGTSRMPIVRESVERWSGRSEIISVMHSDAAPAGASLRAQILLAGPSETLDFQVQEATSRYFGILVVDPKSGQQRVSIVIPQNSSLPATGTGLFHTTEEGQQALALKLVEGRDDGRKATLVGTCQIENLPPGMPAGTPIDVDFHVSENGTVSVFVESIATGRRSAPLIHREGGLSLDQRDRWRDWLYTGSVAGNLGYSK